MRPRRNRVEWSQNTLSKTAQSYVALRRAAGYDYQLEGELRSFVNYAEALGDTHTRVSTACAWAALGRTPTRREARLAVVRVFARYVAAEDAKHELIPHGVFARSGCGPRPPPYILSEEEIGALMLEAGRLPKPRQADALSTLLGLLACTGLRLSEALSLRFTDILEDGVLFILRTKFRKSRLVPLHPEAQQYLAAYTERRRRVRGHHVFCMENGRPWRSSYVEFIFSKLRRRIGLGAPPNRKPPVLHSLRHTFAVRALEASGADPSRTLRRQVALSTYLGHVDLRATYWYFSATPHLMQATSRAALRGFPTLREAQDDAEVCPGGEPT